MKKCITCGRKLHDQATFCDRCGSEQPTQPSPPAYSTQQHKPGRCIRCGRKLHDQARFCDRCGSEQPTEPYSPYITPSMAQRKLTGLDIFKVFMYSWLNQAAWNYERMQGQGYCISMLPGLKKLYRTRQDLAKWLRVHMDFFSTETRTFNIVLGLDLALEEEGADEQEIRRVKTSLMGPLSGVGDAIFGLILLPAFFALGASLAIQGDWFGPIIALLLWVPVTWFAKYSFTLISYRYGTRIGRLVEESERIRESLAVFALAILGGLTAMYVKAKTPIQLTIPAMLKTTAVFSLQNSLDAVVPKLLPLIVTALIFYTLRNKGWPLGRTVLALFVVGIVLAYLGILG